eukprot:PITA_35029
MSNREKEGSIKPPIFDGGNIVYWKVRTTSYLQSLGTDVWEIVEGGYTFPSAIPTDAVGKKKYETNAKVKRAKLHTLRIQYETRDMHNDESIASYFLCIDEIVCCMKNLGEEIKEVTLVEKVLRSLSAKFESKVFSIEENQDLQTITMTQLHIILTAFKMRKGGSSDMREAEFKALGKKNSMNQDIFQKEKKKQTLSRTFNGVPEDSEVNYLSNVFLVEESVIRLPNVPIKISLIRVRNLQNQIKNKV